MKYKKIYSLFIEKIEDEAKSYDVIISFKNLTDRKKFISKNKSLKVIKTCFHCSDERSNLTNFSTASFPVCAVNTLLAIDGLLNDPRNPIS